MRKIVQVATTEAEFGYVTVLAVADDGTLWQKDILPEGQTSPWMRIDDLPQGADGSVEF